MPCLLLHRLQDSPSAGLLTLPVLLCLQLFVFCCSCAGGHVYLSRAQTRDTNESTRVPAGAIVVMTLPAPGHLFPSLALARELQRRYFPDTPIILPTPASEGTSPFEGDHFDAVAAAPKMGFDVLLLNASYARRFTVGSVLLCYLNSFFDVAC